MMSDDQVNAICDNLRAIANALAMIAENTEKAADHLGGIDYEITELRKEIDKCQR